MWRYKRYLCMCQIQVLNLDRYTIARANSQQFQQEMTAIQSYNLTQYTNFRELEFQHQKLRDQNHHLHAKLVIVENMYRQYVESTKHHLYAQQSLTKQCDTFKQMLDQLVRSICRSFSSIHHVFNIQLDLHKKSTQQSVDQRLVQAEIVEEIIQKMEILVTNVDCLNQKQNQLTLKYERQSQKLKDEQKKYKKIEKEGNRQLQILQNEMIRYEEENLSLLAQINVLKRENIELKSETKQLTKIENTRQQSSNKDNMLINDNDFALDLLHYEKELLQRIFTRIINCFKNNDSIVDSLTDVYNGYEAVAEHYCEKLQVQYDLEDLQKQYKREKHSKVQQHLLIELRKQIEQFRNQLSTQKQHLNQAENQLESTLITFQNCQLQDQKIRRYTFELEKQIKQSSQLQTAYQTKHVEDSENPVKTMQSSQYQTHPLRFKQSNTSEQFMKEVVQKDRQNLQKILKETRSGYQRTIEH